MSERQQFHEQILLMVREEMQSQGLIGNVLENHQICNTLLAHDSRYTTGTPIGVPVYAL